MIPPNLRSQVLQNHEHQQECENSPTTIGSNVCEVPELPVSLNEATAGPEKKKWESAMETEMTSLREKSLGSGEVA